MRGGRKCRRGIDLLYSLAGEIISYTPKKVGKAIEKDKSCATVESGKGSDR